MEVAELFDYAYNMVVPPKQEKPPKPSQWLRANFIDPISEKLIILYPWQAKIIDHALQTDEQGFSKYDLVVWSQPKKSGKTTIAGAVACYVACCIESPNEIACVANDQEQSTGRIFAATLPTLKWLKWSVPVSAKGMYRQPMSYGPNGTVIKAITTNYEKEAGGNQGLSLWSELWAYKGERLIRLWEEMTPPPTRKFSMRWVETYAGFIGENILLQDIYLSVFKDFNENELNSRVIKLWDDLPVYEVDEHILVFWDHEHRMPWQTEKYYEKQRLALRPTSFMRLHENKWVESKDTFITYDMWSDSVRLDIEQKPAIYALDASKSSDSTALVGCYRMGDKIITSDIHIWEAEEGKEIDFRLVERTIEDLWNKKLIKAPLYYDPFQAVKLAQDLRAKGIPCEEFHQGQLRVRADTFLYKLYQEKKILNPNHNGLRKHILSASAREYEGEKIRIVKPTSENADVKNNVTKQKVDAVIAQSMAAYMAYMKRSGGWGLTGQ